MKTNTFINRYRNVIFDLVCILVGIGFIILGVNKSVVVTSVQDTVLIGIFSILFGIVFIGNDL